MKMTELPIWPRILAAKPSGSKAAKPSNILRAVIAAGGLKTAGPTTHYFFNHNDPRRLICSGLEAVDHRISGRLDGAARWTQASPLHRSNRWTQPERDRRRAKHDKAFARILKRRADEAALVRALVLHIADRWHNYIAAMVTSKYAGITWGRGTRENVEWDRYAKSYKFPCKYSDAGAGLMDDGRVVLSPVRGNEVFLPALPKSLVKAWDRHAAHPVGLFAVPVKGQPGVVACMSARSGDKKWHVAGFAVAGHRVPECVARGTITMADIQAEANSESQRIMIERFGYDRYLSESGAVAIQEDEFGRLYELPGGHKLARLLNSTANDDGTINEYFLPVPREMQTAHQAVAWSFGMTVEQYQPALQS
jgi:hypothetical protein